MSERMTEIETRLRAISEEIDADGADLDALETEIKALKEERAEIQAEIETAKHEAEQRAMIKEIASFSATEEVIETREARKDEKRMEYTAASPEYRSAWLKNLQGANLDEVEKRALTATAAMPEATVNKIVETMVDMVPLLNEIDLFRIAGNINIPVQTVAPSGTQEAAGGAATEATATLRQVNLTGYNINALISVGADLAQMAVPAFEDWLVRKLSEAIAYKIEDMIVNGDGNSAPKGLQSYVTFDVSDGTGIDATGSNDAFTVANIDSLIGLIPAAYDGNSKFLMSKKTFFTSISSLADENNWPLIEKDGRTFYLRGYPVIFSDKVTAGDVFFGDFRRGMVGNLSTEIKVEKQRNLRYNSWDFLGWAVFDCEPAAAGCIVKLAADIAA